MEAFGVFANLCRLCGKLFSVTIAASGTEKIKLDTRYVLASFSTFLTSYHEVKMKKILP